MKSKLFWDLFINVLFEPTLDIAFQFTIVSICLHLDEKWEEDAMIFIVFKRYWRMEPKPQNFC